MTSETRERGNLIGSDKAKVRPFYGSDRQRIGTIGRIMIDKISSKVLYAALGFRTAKRQRPLRRPVHLTGFDRVFSEAQN